MLFFTGKHRSNLAKPGLIRRHVIPKNTFYIGSTHLFMALNLPALWLAGQFDLLAADARAWLWLAGYSLVSLFGLWLAQRGRAGAHGVGRTGTPAACSAANSPHVGV